MVAWPVNGTENWNDPMEEFVHTEHNTNGTHGTLNTTGDVKAGGFISFGSPSELTIAGGAITATKSYHTVDTAGDASTDNLDTINGGSDGNILVIRPESNLRTVVAKDVTGNLTLAGDFSMGANSDTLTLIYDAETSAWIELSRSDNAG